MPRPSTVHSKGGRPAGSCVRLALIVGLAWSLGGCGAASQAVVAEHGSEHGSEAGVEQGATLELMLELTRMPSGIARVGDRTFIALPRSVEEGGATVVEWTGEALQPYPSLEANALGTGTDALISVNGLHADANGWLWILDNGRVDHGTAEPGRAKLVVWDTVAEREVFRHVFTEEIAPVETSLLNDLAVDTAHGFVYITQTGIGGMASLVTLEIHRDVARNLLVGHASVGPVPTRDMVIDGNAIVLGEPDRPMLWRVGANAIALSPDADTLYWGRTDSARLYSVATRLLRDPTVDAEALQAGIAWIPKPVSDGIAFAADGQLLASDLEDARIVALDRAGGSPVEVISDPRFSYPVAIACDDDGAIWFTANRPHEVPPLGADDDARTPAFSVWRLRP